MRGLLSAVFFSALLQAHALLLEATPKANSLVDGPDVKVNLKFNSRIDAKRSKLTLYLPNGTTRTLELAADAPPDSLISGAVSLSHGLYKIRWQVLASDGHITQGIVPFRIR